MDALPNLGEETYLIVNAAEVQIVGNVKALKNSQGDFRITHPNK